MRRLVAFACVTTIIMTSCGGRDQTPTFPSSYPRPATELQLPEPQPAVPAFLALLDPPPASEQLRRVRKLDGVAVATPVTIATMTIKGRRTTVAAVDPVDFRSVSPSATRDAGFVWSALLAGNAIVSFEAAQELGLQDSNRMRIGTDTIQIGAFADSGSPSVADVLIDRRLAAGLGITGRQALMVGTESVEARGAVARGLERVMGDRLTRLVPQLPEVLGPSDPEPNGSAQGGLIGRMDFKILDNGFIEPDANWVAANIVTTQVPIVGEVICHRLLVPQLSAALAEVEREGLSSLIDASDYGGCYVPRFISRDPERALSMHAFGLAVDLNVQTNLYGTDGQIDPRIVEVFEEWGFEWGGRWDPPDPMHFELDRLLDPSG